jgi:hypothetical protein
MMSADNFFFITPHPLGGFAVLMGFSSSEEPLVVTESAQQYATFSDAMAYANGEYSEYGVQIDSQIFESIEKPSPSSSLRKRCPHTGDVWFDRGVCDCKGGTMHTRCSDCDFAIDGCIVQVNQMLDAQDRETLDNAIAKIRLNHEANHAGEELLPRIMPGGTPMPDLCGCEEIIELISS